MVTSTEVPKKPHFNNVLWVTSGYFESLDKLIKNSLTEIKLFNELYYLISLKVVEKSLF